MNTNSAINFKQKLTNLASILNDTMYETCKHSSCSRCFFSSESDNCSLFLLKQAMMISVCFALLPFETFFRLLAQWTGNMSAGYKELEAKAAALASLQPLLCKYFNELDEYNSEEDYIHLQNADELANEIRSILEI